jgi:hypothetical protein
MHNSWDKNDPKDAQVLLHLLKTDLTQHYHDPLANRIQDFQELSLTYAQVSLEKTRTQHRLLTHYLPLYFPEIERYYHASRSEWLLELLRAYPTPASITCLSMEKFVKQAWPIVGRKVRKQRLLEDIYRTAQSFIGLPVAQDSEAVAMFRVVLGEMVRLCQLRDQLEQRAALHLKPSPGRSRRHRATARAIQYHWRRTYLWRSRFTPERATASSRSEKLADAVVLECADRSRQARAKTQPRSGAGI